MTGIRRGEPTDLPEVAAIQDASPEMAQWRVSEYPEYEFLVAVQDERVAGFLVARQIGVGEREVLNMAVAVEFRGQGLGRDLLAAFLGAGAQLGAVYLEVRESNSAARNLYKSMGFQQIGRRQGYYDNPLEAAIVMKFHSC